MKFMFLVLAAVFNMSLFAQEGGYICIPKAKSDLASLELLAKSSSLSESSYLFETGILLIDGANCEKCEKSDLNCIDSCQVDKTEVQIQKNANSSKKQFVSYLFTENTLTAELICEKENSIEPYPSFGGSN